MNMIEYANRNVPNYYPSMYLDGYSSTEIYIAYQKYIKSKYTNREMIDSKTVKKDLQKLID